MTDILSTVMKKATEIIARPVKVNNGDTEIDKMLLGKELSKWLHRTNKLSENVRQAYTVILGQRTTFTRSNIEILRGWEDMSENLYMIALMKEIKGLILNHDNMEYFYTGMQPSLRGFLDLQQGRMTVTDCH